MIGFILKRILLILFYNLSLISMAFASEIEDPLSDEKILLVGRLLGVDLYYFNGDRELHRSDISINVTCITESAETKKYNVRTDEIGVFWIENLDKGFQCYISKIDIGNGISIEYESKSKNQIKENSKILYMGNILIASNKNEKDRVGTITATGLERVSLDSGYSFLRYIWSKFPGTRWADAIFQELTRLLAEEKEKYCEECEHSKSKAKEQKSNIKKGGIK